MRNSKATTFTRLDICRFILWQTSAWLCEWEQSFLVLFLYAKWSFVRSVSSRFLWYLSLWLTSNRHYVSVRLSIPYFASDSFSRSYYVYFYESVRLMSFPFISDAIYCHIVIRYIRLFLCCKVVGFSHFEMHPHKHFHLNERENTHAHAEQMDCLACEKS